MLLFRRARCLCPIDVLSAGPCLWRNVPTSVDLPVAHLSAKGFDLFAEAVQCGCHIKFWLAAGLWLRLCLLLFEVLPSAVLSRGPFVGPRAGRAFVDSIFRHDLWSYPDLRVIKSSTEPQNEGCSPVADKFEVPLSGNSACAENVEQGVCGEGGR